MKRKFISLFIVILLVVSLPCRVFADTVFGNVVDDAGLFSNTQRAQLDQAAQVLSEQYGIDVFLVTKDTLNGETAVDYAESLYAGGNRGWWESENAILFLLDMGQREWFISTGGEAVYIFTDYGLEQLGAVVVEYLSQGLYYEAFSAYLNELPDYFDAYQSGSPIDGYLNNNSGNYSVNAEDTVYYPQNGEVNILISILSGLIVAGIVLIIMRSSMNTRRDQRNAQDYIATGSYQLYKQRDLFLHSQISKVKKQQSNTSGSRGGGSSVHRGSSGSHHGGRGGKF